jgi:predicted nucleic acid-binding protein
MTILTDSSFIYALYNAKDTRHQRAMDFATQYTGVTVVPDVVLPEVSYLFMRNSTGGLRMHFDSPQQRTYHHRRNNQNSSD